MRGRKRKAGARYPSGRLKPTAEAIAARGPNPKVLAERRVLLGRADAKGEALRKAENPLDCLAERGWIDADLARYGHAYAALHRRAGLYQPRTTLVAAQTPGSSGVEAAALSDLDPEALARVWDEAMARPAAKEPDEGDPEAAAALKALWRVLGFAACVELHSVCLNGAWPMWAMQKVCGRSDVEIPPKWLRKRGVLIEGLERVREHLNPRLAPEPKRERRTLARAVEETIVYVDDDGFADPVVNKAGRAVEVVRVRRQ